MSGPLRRLARQITGVKTPRVHPMARLPFAPAPELPADRVQEATPEQLIGGPGEPASGPLPHRPAAQTLADTPDAVDSPPARQSDSEQLGRPAARDAGPAGIRAAVTPTTEGEVPPLSASMDMTGTTGPANGPARAGEVGGARGHLSSPQPSAPMPGPMTGLPAGSIPDRLGSYPETPRPAVEPAPLGISKAPGRESGPGFKTDTLPVIEPEPLVPTHRAVSAGTLSPSSRTVPDSPAHWYPGQAPAAPAAYGSRQAPDEIHVHIGRIEVTAVQETPAAAPRRRPKGREPMSLDDYLAKRRSSK